MFKRSLMMIFMLLSLLSKGQQQNNRENELWIAWLGNPLVIQQIIHNDKRTGPVYLVCEDTVKVREYLKKRKITDRKVFLKEMSDEHAKQMVKSNVCLTR